MLFITKHFLKKGALTSKSRVFSLRTWDVKKKLTLDPTDGFLTWVIAFFTPTEVLQLEPNSFDYNTTNLWITDKSRHFFDGLFSNMNNTLFYAKKQKYTKFDLPHIIKIISEALFLFHQCKIKLLKKKYLTLLFENLSIELACFFTFFLEKNYFLKLQRLEETQLVNDLEAFLQLNAITENVELKNSNFCLILSCNPWYEGSSLNTSIRHRFLMGNFHSVILGSLIDLNYYSYILGSNNKAIKTILSGNNPICQYLKTSQEPLLITNYEFFKRYNLENIAYVFKILKYSNILTSTWNGLNILSPSISEVGTRNINYFSFFKEKDLISINILYYLNIHASSLSLLKKILELKLLNNSTFLKNKSISNSLFINQNYKNETNIKNLFKEILFNTQIYKTWLIYIPSSSWYENNETFFNTEGFIRRTSKLISKKRTQNSFQVIKNFFRNINIKLTQLCNNENNLWVFYQFKKVLNFKNYINFNYQATQILKPIDLYLKIKNKPFILKSFFKFKIKYKKIKLTKLKYWLDDFYNGGKDEYSAYSFILANCAKFVKLETTNFF